jgi:hypothetical protein
MLSANLASDTRHRDRLAAAIERRSRVFGIDTLKRGGKAVRIAFAPLLAVGDDIEAYALLIPDREKCCLILFCFKSLRIDQPEIIHPYARHHLRQPCAIDQPLRLRIGTDERRRKKLSRHESTSRASLCRFETHFENASDV